MLQGGTRLPSQRSAGRGKACSEYCSRELSMTASAFTLFGWAGYMLAAAASGPIGA